MGLYIVVVRLYIVVAGMPDQRKAFGLSSCVSLIGLGLPNSVSSIFLSQLCCCVPLEEQQICVLYVRRIKHKLLIIAGLRFISVTAFTATKGRKESMQAACRKERF